jgi:hypothetical protein
VPTYDVVALIQEFALCNLVVVSVSDAGLGLGEEEDDRGNN